MDTITDVAELLRKQNKLICLLLVRTFGTSKGAAKVIRGEIDKITEETLKAMPKQDSFLLSQAIKWLDRRDVKHFLGLEAVISTKLTGYEKEVFVLKCYANFIMPGIILRVGTRLIGQGFDFQERDIIPLDKLI